MLSRYGCVILKKSFEVFGADIYSSPDLDDWDPIAFKPFSGGVRCHLHNLGDVFDCEKTDFYIHENPDVMSMACFELLMLVLYKLTLCKSSKI